MSSVLTGIFAETDVSNLTDVFVWSTILIVLLILIFFAYSQLKRWMQGRDDPTGGGFTLSDLRELHRQGKMSTPEFEAAKAKMVENARKNQ
jgi:uncharacterized membrane protein